MDSTANASAPNHSSKKRERTTSAKKAKPDKRRRISYDVADGDSPQDKTERESRLEEQQHKIKSTLANSSSNKSHVRFGSEEPAQPEQDLESAAAQVAAPEAGDQDDEESESDEGDAPEAVSTSVAAASTRAAAAGLAQSIQQQKDRDRKKRQEKAAKQKEQALKSEKKTSSKGEVKGEGRKESTKKIAQGPGSVRIPVVENDGGDEISEDDDALDLLPEELLAEEFIRPPTPPPEAKQDNQIAMAKGRRIQLDDKKPKDMKVGAINVSVLEKHNKLLPPKANTNSRGVREAWLAGRMAGKGGKGGAKGLERTAFSRKFVAH